MFLLLLISELFHPSAPPPSESVLVQIPTMALVVGQPVDVPTPQEPKLEISGGDVRVVKVNKVITIQEDRTVVQKLPFNLKAPPGAMLYSWTFSPPNVVGVKLGNRFEVTSAPKGTISVVVEMVKLNLSIDWIKQTSKTDFTTEVARDTFDVGAAVVVPPPPPVDPVVIPPVVLEEKLGFATLAKTEAEKIQNATEKAKAIRLADNFEAMQAKLAATSAMTIDQANAELTKNNQSIELDRPSWLPWFQAWKAKADAMPATKENYVQAFRETAVGLRAAK